ncbi:hypothetical protein CKF54_04380 [Psittacicella hinzii]|uniref:Membrane protein required for colicin V production n=1 Tax=Psittacicella hinzii TaxID=2028575 RepID=A0A3A1Y676_9GAMM|nr:CvpA family protein [Psittacicella hinzii]RIY32698.1 hypothetical protein CKF54_04380 [Psittacicella hinzii]
MFSIADLFLGIIVLVFFVRGYLKGFLGSVLSLVALAGSIFIALNYTSDFYNTLSKVPYVTSYPVIALIIVFLISYIFLGLAARALTALFGRSIVLSNPLLSLLGGVIYAFVTILVISVVYTLLKENGVDVDHIVSSFDQSYSKRVIDYCNSGFNITEKVKEIFNPTVIDKALGK